MRGLGILITALLLAAHVSAAEQKPGDTFKDCETCPVMVVLPSGKAMLGAEAWDQDMKPGWGALREVNITYSFAVAKTETTRALYRQFVKETKYVSPTTSCNTWPKINWEIFCTCNKIQDINLKIHKLIYK